MCGIAGLLRWSAPPDRTVVEQMTAMMARRGPDGSGVAAYGPIVLGHRRLAVIDLSPAAAQPMSDTSGRFALVYNGELYNFRDLRRELATAGARFRSSSDTEVVLEAYKRWDTACLERLNGMFAFALWDAARERLVLARDRAGEKPLFYAADADGVAFASELKALRPALGDRPIQPRALGQYLAMNYILGSDCLVDGVQKLEAAHVLVVERGRTAAPARYWDLASHFRTKQRFSSDDEAAEALRAEIDRAVRERLVSDVPLGAFLSGGIDSSAIVAAMGAARPAELNETFSIGFGEASYDERTWAAQAAAAMGVTQHHERSVDPAMATALSQIVSAGDEPMADTSIVPTYYLAAFARERVTVCLSGDGGDELFGGYETYLADQLHQATRAVPAPVARSMARLADRALPVAFDKVSTDYKIRKFLNGHALPFRRAHYSWREIFSPSERRALVRAEHHRAVLGDDPYDAYARHYDDVRDCHYLDQAMYVDIKTWLADDILVKVDRMTMANSLESRAPFLDHRLMELAASLPPRLKVRGRSTKILLKRSQRGRVPDTVLQRKKQGFNAPVAHWFAGPLRDLGRAATAPTVLGEWFEPAAIEQLWSEHAAGRRDHGFRLFALVTFGLWLQQRTNAV